MSRSLTNRVSLGFFPTPVHELKNLSGYLAGPRLFVKRDDQTGLAFGGNKTRKLEFLIAEAIGRGCDTVVTGGAEQSNHCRQTAAASALYGLDCHLVLGGSPPEIPDGNLLLDMLCGAKIHWTGELRKGEKIPQIYRALEEDGKIPFLIPYGGSNPVGALGFVEAVNELVLQCDKNKINFSHIIFASSSGGTHAGMTAGKKIFGLDSDLIGIAIDKDETGGLSIKDNILKILHEMKERFFLTEAFSKKDIILREEYTGEGYGVVGDLEKEAIRLCASKEGIILDPVYTGRAMGALIDLIQKKEFSSKDNILFWHTGGAPSIFYYSKNILN